MAFPVYAKDFTNADLTTLISARYPGSAVAHFSVVGGHQYGDGEASTAGRCSFDVAYTPGSSPELPTRLVVKVTSIDATPAHQELYRNELDFYQRLRPQLDLETPKSFGGFHDPQSGGFALAMEDLTQRGATFMSNQVDHTKQNVCAVLDVFAKLHAHYWLSPDLTTGLAWLQTHNSGPLAFMMESPDLVPAHIAAITAKWRFKREMIQGIGSTLEDLHREMLTVQEYRMTLPQTVLHGDGHVGNTYRVGQAGGLLDWQLTIRGHFMHDVGYYIQTSLAVGDRRAWEKELITYYLDRLRQEGVAEPPSFDDAWFAYRLSCAWNVYVGWLTTDVDNYGWEICELAHLRVMTAYRDLEAAAAIAKIR